MRFGAADGGVGSVGEGKGGATWGTEKRRGRLGGRAKRVELDRGNQWHPVEEQGHVGVIWRNVSMKFDD